MVRHVMMLRAFCTCFKSWYQAYRLHTLLLTLHCKNCHELPIPPGCILSEWFLSRCSGSSSPSMMFTHACSSIQIS